MSVKLNIGNILNSFSIVFHPILAIKWLKVQDNYPQTSQIDFWLFTLASTKHYLHKKWCLTLPAEYDASTHNMDAREKQPGVFLTFAMKTHTLLTYLAIKLFKINRHKWDIKYIDYPVRTLLLMGLRCLGTITGSMHKHLPDIYSFFFLKWLTHLNFMHTYIVLLSEQDAQNHMRLFAR